MARPDGRANDQLRPVKIIPGYLDFAEGSAIIELGKTRVLCSATVEDRVPGFLKGMEKGWLTAEYSMLPRSTYQRTPREEAQGGRSQEIQRLIGRSLRAVADLSALGERTIVLDCDVLQADAGTRVAAITAAWVALYQAIGYLRKVGLLSRSPLRDMVAAVSVGMVNGEARLDMCYEEDAKAEVDFNVVMSGQGEIVEVQGTAEAKPFSKATMDTLLNLAHQGIKELFKAQRSALAQLKA